MIAPVSTVPGAGRTLRVACFGGSFDPPHPTHRRVALAAQRLLALDAVLFLPAGRQPLKQQEAAPFADRVAMLELAIAGHAGLSVSILDAPLERGANYTVDLLERLRPSLPAGAQLYFVGGADTFLTLPHWRAPERLLRAGELLDGWILAARPGFPFRQLAEALPPGFRLRSEHTTRSQEGLEVAEVLPQEGHPPLPLWLLTGLEDPTAATTIRDQLARGEQPDLDPGVLAYIRAHGLYAGRMLG